MAVMYFTGVAATWGYNRLMAKAAQQIILEIRSDLFCHVQTLPLKFFDSRTHGELMSNFTNDIVTLADALNKQLYAADSELHDAVRHTGHAFPSELASFSDCGAFPFVDVFVYSIQQQEKPQIFPEAAGIYGFRQQLCGGNGNGTEGGKGI